MFTRARGSMIFSTNCENLLFSLDNNYYIAVTDGQCVIIALEMRSAYYNNNH